MKEAYSNSLLASVLRQTSLSDNASLSLFDPFSGSGTTGVSAGDLVRSGNLASAQVEALEVNPLLHLISRAKMSAHAYERGDLRTIAGRVARRAMSESDGLAPIPALTTFANRQYISETNLNALLALRASIEAVSSDSDLEQTVDILKVAFAAAVEPSTNLRRDGRALRFSAGSAAAEPLDLFLHSIDEMADDVAQLQNTFGYRVHFADSREPLPNHASHDISVFSPPYPNNIDYTEVYKLEGWLLGLYGSSEDFAQQRRRTLRSHYSLRWNTPYRYETALYSSAVDDLLAPILEAIPQDRYSSGRIEVVRGYADDMLATLLNVAGNVRAGGKMAIIVGNSFHGRDGSGYVIASDLILSELARLAGFEVDQIEIARYPKRRKAISAYLRESVIFATKRS